MIEQENTGDSDKICKKKSYVGLYGYSADVEPGGFNDAIAQFIGRAPNGAWRIFVENGCRTLRYKDEQGEAEATVTRIENIASFLPPGAVFDEANLINMFEWGSVESIRLNTPDGRELKALMRFNAQPSPFAIDLFEEGRKLPLFRASSPWEIQHESLDVRFGITYLPD